MSSPEPTNEQTENKNVEDDKNPVEDDKNQVTVTDIKEKKNLSDIHKKTINLLDKINSKFEYKEQKTANGITYDDLASGLKSPNEIVNSFIKPKKKLYNSYTTEERTRLDNFNKLKGYLRNVYDFFENNEIDSRIDSILSRLTPHRGSVNVNDRFNGNRSILSIAPPDTSKLGPFAGVAGVIWVPLSVISTVYRKGENVIVATLISNYKTRLQELQKYVIDKGILTEAEGAELDKQQNAGTKPMLGGKTRNNRQSKKLNRKPKRKGGRKSRKH